MEDCQHLGRSVGRDRTTGRFAPPKRDLNARLDLLIRHDRASAGLILAGAIPYAERDELPGLALAAVRSADPRALAAVVRRMHELESEDAASIAVAAAPFDSAIRHVLARPTETACRNVLELIAARRDPAVLHHLVGLLDDHRSSIVDRAAAVMLEVVIAQLGTRGRRRVSATAADQIDRAIAEAGGRYRAHRRDEILIAGAISAIRPGPELRRILDDEDHPFTIALRGVADRLDRPIVRGNLIRWLETPAVRSSVERAFHRLGDVDATAEALGDGHLLRGRSRGPALRRFARPIRCLPAVDRLTELPTRAQSHLPTLIARLDLSASTRIERLAALCGSSSPIARLRALEALLAMNDHRAGPIIEQRCLDPQRAVAHLAAQHLGQMRAIDHRVPEHVAAARHPSLAGRAEAMLARGGAEEFRRRFARLNPAQRSAAVVALAAQDPEGLLDALRETIRSDDPRRSVAAIMLARRRRMVVDLEDELLALAQHENARIASAAIAALGEGQTPHRRTVLRAALDHHDPRAQANAIEALARGGDDADVDAIRPLVHIRRNRARGNAVRATLIHDRSAGSEDLDGMLADPDPLHRISAIWAVRTARARGAAGMLARLAGEDEHAEIRIRARAALRFLGGAAPSGIDQKEVRA